MSEILIWPTVVGIIITIRTITETTILRIDFEVYVDLSINFEDMPYLC